jgi:signal transduction histidine kinase
MSFVRSSSDSRASWWIIVEPPGPRRRIKITFAVAAVFAIGLVDAATGPEWSMQIFYLVPVAWVATVAGRRAGWALALLSATAAFVADVVIPKSSDRVAAAFNATFMLVTLLIVVELLDRLRQRADAATAAEQRSRQFLAYAAHQLRTPLAAVGATVDALMLCDDTDPARDELLMRLGAENARAARLLHGLLRVARLDQHEPLAFRPTDLAPLVQSEVGRAERNRNLTWTTSLGLPADATIDCDPDALGEALANLFDNAVRHADNEITIDVRNADDLIEICVRDDGPGLLAAAIHGAFERFVTMDGYGGSGLGLPIARGIAEAHGGTLTYEAGAFVLRIPRHHHAPNRHDQVNTPRIVRSARNET